MGGSQAPVDQPKKDDAVPSAPTVTALAPVDASPSKKPASSGGNSGTRLSRRHTEVESFTDLRPAVIKWLGGQDALFGMLEQNLGLEREKIFYGVCIAASLYMIAGPGCGLICNLIGFAYPAYCSVKAIRSEEKDDDTQWLIYWTTFAAFSLVDFFAERIYSFFPLYWLAKIIFLLYLALPQTQGAHNLYVLYVDPAFDKLSSSMTKE